MEAAEEELEGSKSEWAIVGMVSEPGGHGSVEQEKDGQGLQKTALDAAGEVTLVNAGSFEQPTIIGSGQKETVQQREAVEENSL